MNVMASYGTDELARVYVADMGEAKEDLIEFVESVVPPIPRSEKWVLIISVLKGCPVGCLMCDANHSFRGMLSKEELFQQIDFLIMQRYPDLSVRRSISSSCSAIQT